MARQKKTKLNNKRPIESYEHRDKERVNSRFYEFTISGTETFAASVTYVRINGLTCRSVPQITGSVRCQHKASGNWHVIISTL